MYYITKEMRSTYKQIPNGYMILVDYGTFSQAQWNKWSVVKIENMMYYAVA